MELSTPITTGNKGSRFLSEMLLIAGLVLSQGSCAQSSYHVKILREINLSHEQGPIPYSITRTSEGDFVVAGAYGIEGSHSWATRVDSSGRIVWDYVDQAPNGQTDDTTRAERFYSAMGIEDRKTLLCGVKKIGGTRSGFLLRLNADGSRIDERALHSSDGLSVMSAQCIRWGSGFAVLGVVSISDHGTGWLAKLDSKGTLLWDKTADFYAGAEMRELPDSGLLIISSRIKSSALFKLNERAELVSRISIPDGGWHFVDHDSTRDGYRLLFQAPDANTRLIEFDDQLRGQRQTLQLGRVGINKSLEMQDRTVAIFGSHFDSQATASVTLVNANGRSQTIVLEPRYRSPWFYDATQTPDPHIFAAVSLVQGAPVLSWLQIE